ncbi:NAD(P)/FAD-dependent oxidoreductase [Alloprevotella sp. oral taxon 473]|uniref:NAD(P)/FAD-dependent oxidoreductase n=1 Tax=Alloprevotella sp. oral taxon 473 TaxID=712469 RepID=UPI0002A44050|nr:NAD(P)/FAD-dependent oxidoreductase [Alloprevotella sp. oral taxon 473]EKX92360.1 pyridine nucleotide-disulfide oxidoreductase [Alloprevotella sp. oral taxon 473 str. F0040]
MTTLQLRVLPEVAYDAANLRTDVAQRLEVSPQQIHAIRPVKRSIDARQRQVMVNLTLEVFIDEDPTSLSYERIHYGDVSRAPQAVVVGAGPGGLFAALRLVELGVRPIVLERGRDVNGRKKDIAAISRDHIVDSESNYSFGEGGAGAFSDGKLYTRSKKRGNVQRILSIFCQHGASTDILADAHPHIGTDRLPGIIERMREQIKSSGGEVHFQTRVDELLFSADGDRVVGVRTADGKEFHGPVILATGHSARDVYRYLHQAGVEIEQKSLAMGVRLEHPSHLIDQIQYHNRQGRGKYLPAAEYSFVQQVQNRGVYSFCMCPGGFVVPAATGPEQLVVNGMSPANRGSKWSNSGMVVETRPEDIDGELMPFLLEAMNDESFAAAHTDFNDKHNPLRMMYVQEALERAAWIQGGRSQVAPAQRMADFVNNRLSADLPKSSYNAGLVASPLHFWLPKFITTRLQEGFKAFGRRSRGFLTDEAILIATESRTSAPVRILRTPETLQHIRLEGLFPCGEGAGYAGGIVSAAMDGERCAEALSQTLGICAT